MQFVIFLCCAFFPANEQHTKSFAVAFLNSTLSVCSCTYIFYTQKQFSWYTLSGRIDDDDCVPLTHSFSFQCVSLSHTRWIKVMRCCLLAHSSYMHNVKNQFLVALSLSLSLTLLSVSMIYVSSLHLKLDNVKKLFYISQASSHEKIAL